MTISRLIRSRAGTLGLAFTFLLGSFAAATVNVNCHAQIVVGPNDAPGKAGFGKADSGTLVAFAPGGKTVGQCPLKHTDVKAKVSGYVARVSVKQTFQNTFKEKIEAVYTFPLPEDAAVDEMTMKVGKRIIRGTIKKREEARDIYEAARARGQVASLLDQERTNIFTQSVANIEPGESVEIEIKYVNLLPFEAGAYTFSFPTVVGPRFMPGSSTGQSGTGRLPDTTGVPDGSKISPPLAPKGERAGHDISIDLDIDAGVPINSITSKLHEVKLEHAGASRSAHLSLLNKTTIPNKDFVVTWEVAGDTLKSGYLTHHDGKQGYFTLMMLPPKKVTVENVAPKEMIFVIDCSGSQRGKPMEKARETLKYIVDNMNPNDTFQIVSFNDVVREFPSQPEKAGPEMQKKAKQFIDWLDATGGTWMGPAVEKVCAKPIDENRLRIVTFMTDGYVGNDYEIIGMVRKYRNKSRWFTFGTGNSVNRNLIEGVAKEGGGEPDYVYLNSPGEEVAKKFYDRIKSPVLTDVKIDFGTLKTKEVFPHQVSDVWAERPLYFKGRYLEPGAGTITLTGFASGKPYKQEMKVDFSAKAPGNEVIKPIWARAKIDRLMSEDYFGVQHDKMHKELKDEIVATALEYHLMSQYTSFVAVEEKTITKGGDPKKVTVPVEVPDGVSREGIEGQVGSSAPVYTAGGMVPPTTMGKFVRQPGSNQYGAPSAMSYGNVGYGIAGGARGIGAGAGASLGMSTGAVSGALRAKKGDGGTFYSAPRQVQAVDQRPVVKDFRQAPSEKSSIALAEPAKQEETKAKPKNEAEKNTDNRRKLIGGLAKLLTDPNAKIPGVQITDGKITVLLTLKDESPATIEKLKQIGVTVVSTTPKAAVARISIEKLKELIKLDEVERVLPLPKKYTK